MAIRVRPAVPGSLSEDTTDDMDDSLQNCFDSSQVSKVTSAFEPQPLGLPRLDSAKQIKCYMGMDATPGIANLLASENTQIACRIFLLDNSGSTAQPDGHVLHSKGAGFELTDATRWEEICAMALDQAEWNGRAHVRCEFLLLNPPCPQNPQRNIDFVIIDPDSGPLPQQLDNLRRLLSQNGPRGPTPLTARLNSLRDRLVREVVDGRRVMLSIVTDGLPTSEFCGKCTSADQRDFVNALRRFTSSLNSFVVIRLATDDDAAVDYYNKIDEELELPLDILDDLRGEAQEVYDAGNGWFAYTPMIHRIREGGTMEKLFDLLDERALMPIEISTFLQILLQAPGDAAFPRKPQELLPVVRKALEHAPPVYNARLGCMTAPVDMKLLEKALGLSNKLSDLPARICAALIRLTK